MYAIRSYYGISASLAHWITFAFGFSFANLPAHGDRNMYGSTKRPAARETNVALLSLPNHTTQTKPIKNHDFMGQAQEIDQEVGRNGRGDGVGEHLRDQSYNFV